VWSPVVNIDLKDSYFYEVELANQSVKTTVHKETILNWLLEKLKL